MCGTSLSGYGKITMLALCTLLMVCSCGSLPPVFADKDLLSFLTPGMSQEAILLKLGEPSASFESGRVLTYRIGEDEEKGYFLLDRQVRWDNAKYSLVLVFDENKLLTKHSLVQVR